MRSFLILLLSLWLSTSALAATMPDASQLKQALDEAKADWRDLLRQLPDNAPRGIEFPLEGEDLLAVTRRYVSLLRTL